MSSFSGNNINDKGNLELTMLRQLTEADVRGKSLDIFIVDENNCLVVDEEGNFILPE